ncbi:hypothetical protein DFQ29_002360, partial [Apophysomyces sp. BC1021]
MEKSGFSCVELRSAVVPRSWEDRIYWVRVTELLLKLKDVCLEQDQLTKQLQSKHVDLIEVKKTHQ